MTALPNAFEQALYNALKPWLNAKVWRVAFSGGVDSSALLHALARLRSHYPLPELHAHYIDHGLQAVAAAWPLHCQGFCAARQIECSVHKVVVGRGASLEQAARQARYGVFESLVDESSVLLSAQHQDDHAETFLFRALRGAGVRGLSAMAKSRPLGQGQLVRPLLGVSRQKIEHYAHAQGLDWLEDPSNTDTRFARNFLRQQVLPTLRQMWPAASKTLARAAEHQAEAYALLNELAEHDVACAEAKVSHWPYPVLHLPPIKALSEARQRNLLRHWLGQWLKLPDTEHWAGWQNLRDAKACATPVWSLDGWQLERADEHIWLVPKAFGQFAQEPVEVKQTGKLCLPDNGFVELQVPVSAGKWRIDYRKGGESMLIAARGRRDLKRLLNEARVPRFMRQRLPLLYCDDKLVAIANQPTLCWQDVKLIWCPLTD